MVNYINIINHFDSEISNNIGLKTAILCCKKAMIVLARLYQAVIPNEYYKKEIIELYKEAIKLDYMCNVRII